MNASHPRPVKPRYTISPDRAGHALAAGSLAIGITTVGVLLAGGARGAGALLSAGLIATFFGIIAIVTVGGPAWFALHSAGQRGPRTAAAAGFGCALLLALFGRLLMPVAEGDDGLHGLVVAIASSLGIALIGAGVALLMWRIAYRSDEPLELTRP